MIIKNWRDVVGARIHHFLLSKNRKKIYIAYNEQGFLREYEIEGFKLTRDYGKVCESWVYTNLISPCGNFLFLMSNNGTLVQLSLDNNAKNKKPNTKPFYKLWGKKCFAEITIPQTFRIPINSVSITHNFDSSFDLSDFIAGLNLMSNDKTLLNPNNDFIKLRFENNSNHVLAYSTVNKYNLVKEKFSLKPKQSNIITVNKHKPWIIKTSYNDKLVALYEPKEEDNLQNTIGKTYVLSTSCALKTSMSLANKPFMFIKSKMDLS